VDSDPGGQKTCESGGSGTLPVMTIKQGLGEKRLKRDKFKKDTSTISQTS
jgi:hypothetical protein